MNIIETQRLIISEATYEDVDALAAVLSDAKIMKYSIVGIHTKEQIIDFIKNCQHNYQEKGYGQWVIYSKENQSFLGICGLNSHKVEEEEILHVNYRLAHAHQGKGYACEATRALLSFSKKQLNIKTLSALIDPGNLPSIKVAKTVVFSFKKTSKLQGYHVDIYQISLENQ